MSGSGVSVSSTELAALVDGRHHGDARSVEVLVSVARPVPGAVAVWPKPDPARIGALAQAGLVALIVEEVRVDEETLRAAALREGVALVGVRDTRVALARTSARLDARPATTPPGIAASAVVDASARLGADVRIGPGAYVGPDATIGEGTAIGARCSVGAGSSVGAHGVLHDGVVLYDGVRIGDRVRLHAGVVIGADGFGYAFGPNGAEKIHHLGGVTIGDDVELGANTAVDRGTLDDTRIGNRVKVDNLCQIGHNVVIGDDAVIAGLSGLAGSCRIGARVVMGGGCMIADHVTVGDDVRLAGGSGVSKEIPAGETWGGLPAQPFRGWVRERYLINKLERMWQAVRAAGEPR